MPYSIMLSMTPTTMERTLLMTPNVVNVQQLIIQAMHRLTDTDTLMGTLQHTFTDTPTHIIILIRMHTHMLTVMYMLILQ